MSTLLTKLNRDCNQKNTSIYGSGFLDITRLAKGHESIWLDIVKNNVVSIDHSLVGLVDEINAFRKAMKDGDWKGVERVLRESREYRERVEEKIKDEKIKKGTVES